MPELSLQNTFLLRFNLLVTPLTRSGCSPNKFTRGEIAIARYDLLMKQRLDATVTAENARKSRKLEANKVLQKGGVLYSENTRRMNQERLQLKRAREQEREAA